MLSGNGRHRRPRQAPALLVAAGVTGSAIAIPLLAASGASAADGTVWDKVAQCETGGSWSADQGDGEYGGLNLTQKNWEAYGGLDYAASPDLASRNQQIAVAQKVLAAQGIGAWGTCGLTSGLTQDNGALGVDTGVADDSSDSSESSDSSGSSGLSDLSRGLSGSSGSSADGDSSAGSSDSSDTPDSSADKSSSPSASASSPPPPPRTTPPVPGVGGAGRRARARPRLRRKRANRTIPSRMPVLGASSTPARSVRAATAAPQPTRPRPRARPTPPRTARRPRPPAGMPRPPMLSRRATPSSPSPTPLASTADGVPSTPRTGASSAATRATSLPVRPSTQGWNRAQSPRKSAVVHVTLRAECPVW